MIVPMLLHSLAVTLAFTLQSPIKDEVGAPPRELVAAWGLAQVYTKHMSVEGLPVLASAKVSDFAVREAAFLIRQMVGHRPEILRAMAAQKVRFVVMAPTEMTTDVPEHSDLAPRLYWNRRARGLGATSARPAVSCGEENLLDLPGDPYATENILIHEFAHSVHEQGMRVVDPTFDTRLQAAFEHARQTGLWKGTYAMQNRAEYWAEATQSWFDCNRADDHDHGPIDTRDDLEPYDKDVAALLTEVFGNRPWRYRKPAQRPATEHAHLVGFDVATAGRFVWPERAPNLDTQGELLAWLDPATAPSASPRTGGAATSVHFVNRRKGPVSIAWLDFDGQRKPYAELRPGLTHLQGTFAGHVWVVVAGDQVLGTVAAGATTGRVEIAPTADAPTENDTRTIAGWTVHVRRELLARQALPTARALELLQAQLEEIVRVVPTDAVVELQKVALWISPEYRGVPPTAEYHPDAGWLRAHARNPAMARAVEFTNVRTFEAECRRMPMLALHELTHAYHHRVLGYDDARILAAYAQAKEGGQYARVERQDAEGRKSMDRAYALTNAQEYFAEITEAFFGRNDFFPYTRDELQAHDPAGFAMAQQVWRVPAK